ncbi:uncharacterized protein LOC110456509 isoform X3 [Mizuhopecten yessoensis]|uniref:Constitutive coactivator of peroxisome proliferator-activated receptor gamma n=1 Tax=Mizuhopecten yessoensis TaxID=6573 RepID=A0A210QAR5_MIZYE|nr:uncharacterized protein LOC110456509 isoform X1 [Mizuhopecten yessoensis]XP_021362972.1 uncharacterized protein LOC110456509 isoform X1 [Mizuhopecten yessoensis]XP_021362973.1 uncharacterized protein LOC110456509 isoform X1 [Mizuhopecten yessoensis]XP_021362974.1 uncharacterized protein LOC110456509 isoform X2 [Mizuhopecten yessoensis]XP_021362975.1 uncharacterized protein LOC110456509 isoform X3 [Mizuhopecten yessoensis]OWF45827.1 hypothetical protein KP79_PYT01511 [Mizuhopecten yessoensis
MGVRGLLSACMRQRNACVHEVDLIQVARERGGIEILVDYYSFELFVMEQFWFSLCHHQHNDYLWILGGEYASLDVYLKKLIQHLKALGIQLVFFVDGARGASTETTREKLDTWIERHHRELGKIRDIMSVCCGFMPITELQENVRATLQEEQFKHTLRQCDCEVYQDPAGEADCVIAQALHQREKAYAVFSNDSDFCIFRDCTFIPRTQFDLMGDLQLGAVCDMPIKPERLMVGVITTDRVMAILGLPRHDLLVELSIVGGNDFTGQYIHKGGLQQKLEIKGRGIEGVADWIRDHTVPETHPVFAQEMRHNMGFRGAVVHSRNFYNLGVPPLKPSKTGHLSQILEKGIREGHFVARVMGMHNNFYWHRAVVEDLSEGQPCAEVALAPLRAHVYRIVLQRHESMVEEYGRSPWEPMRTAGVLAVEDSNIPSIHRIQPDKIFWNLKHFHYIMSHMERRTGSESKWFERYGRKTGFSVYLLRYFLLLNWGRNLFVTENEFLALLAMSLGRPSAAKYQGICVRPTPRCVTLGSWYQDLYYHAYCFLGKLLSISHEFPLPCEAYSGAVWTVFYTCAKDETFKAALSQVPMHELKNTQNDMNAIIKEKRHMIRYIAEGIFQFDDRF